MLPKSFIRLPNNRKLLIIVGPTSSGKTEMALKLANKYSGELISADSRQIYQGMDIGTGKDLPKKAEFYSRPDLIEVCARRGCLSAESADTSEVDPERNENISIQELRRIGGLDRMNSGIRPKWNIGYYKVDGIPLWGLDLITPKYDFSVVFWVKLVKCLLADIFSRHKLAIIVGGTGFWIKTLLDGIEWGGIQPDKKLKIKYPRLWRGRQKLKITDLQEELKKYPKKFQANLSESDWQNPRRLIRRIEIAKYLKKHPDFDPAVKGLDKGIKIHLIRLQIDKQELKKRIKKRINQRLKQGLIKEIERLLKKGYSFDDQGLNTLGYKEFRQYFNLAIKDKRVLKEAIDQWLKDEIDYSRRQQVFFNKYFTSKRKIFYS